MTKPKPLVILDCDGVLADFNGGIVAALAAAGVVVRGPFTSYDWMRADPAVWKAAQAILETTAFWSTLPVVEGAAIGVRILRGAAELTVATAPWWSCEAWEHTRRTWLGDHFGFSKADVVSTHRKHYLRGAAFVDDKYESVDLWGRENVGAAALLFDQPYNRDAPGRLQRFTWGEADVGALVRRLHG